MVQQWRLLLRLRRSHRRTWFQRCWRTCRQTSCAMRCSAGAFLEEPALFYASCLLFLFRLRRFSVAATRHPFSGPLARHLVVA